MTTSDKIVTFPPGFHMLVGDPYKRSMPDATLLDGGGIYLGRDPGQGIPQPVQFTCPTGDGSNPYAKQNRFGNAGLGFPMANCDAYTTGLRYEVYFPDCWDGKSLTDYTSGRNFSSTAGTNGGEQNCLEGWTHFPAMHMEVYWDIDSFAKSGVWNPAKDNWPFELAQGDPTGFGIHGDFVSLHAAVLDPSANIRLTNSSLPVGKPTFCKPSLMNAKPVMVTTRSMHAWMPRQLTPTTR